MMSKVCTPSRHNSTPTPCHYHTVIVRHAQTKSPFCVSRINKLRKHAKSHHFPFPLISTESNPSRYIDNTRYHLYTGRTHKRAPFFFILSVVLSTASTAGATTPLPPYYVTNKFPFSIRIHNIFGVCVLVY